MSITRIVLSGIARFVSTAYFSTALMSSSVMTTAFFGAWASATAGHLRSAPMQIRTITNEVCALTLMDSSK